MQIQIKERTFYKKVLLTGAILSFLLFVCNTLPAQKIKVACVGNSVTYGYLLKDPATQSYPAVLQQMLGDGYQVGNFGHSGATLLKNGHNPYYKTAEFKAAIQMQPDLVIINLGLNDTDPRDYALYRDQFVADYSWLIDTFIRANKSVKIYLCKMTPIFTGHPRFMSSTAIWYKLVQRDIEKIASIRQLPLIDLYANFHDRPDLFTDQPTLHPNLAGARKLATVIYQHITGNFGGLKLADIFTDNMVLQREQPIKIWGTANAATTVTIRFHGMTKKVQVPFNGHWQLKFPAEKASRQPSVMTIENEGRKIQLNNILVGDVWLASGQSNMLFTVQEATKADSLIKSSTNSPCTLRLFNYKNLAATNNVNWDTSVLNKINNLQFFSGTWQLPDPESVRTFSAVGYVFGRQIALEKDIPVGIIEIAVGGSPLLSWVDRATLENNALFEPALNDYLHSDYLMAWCRQRAGKNIALSTSPYQRHPYEPAYNFEAGIAKIAGLPIKGVIWYQGESDADNAPLYGKLFGVFVKSWRQAWHQELPFYYVQLSSLDRPSWNYFRDLQRKLQYQVPHTKMVVTTDLGDSLNVHYPDKIPVGQRLALAALKETYHQNIEDSGPEFISLSKINKGTASMLRVRFDHAAGLTTKENQPLRGFELMDSLGNLWPVKARIQGRDVLLTVPATIPIQSVVYGWHGFSRANLINSSGLPASTFKADLNPSPDLPLKNDPSDATTKKHQLIIQ